MDLRGLYKFTLVDYPGRIACIIFTGGCNFRCPYCHNAALVLDPGSQPRVTEAEFFNFLASRQGRLEGVVISGGEPTIHADLPEFCAKIKAMGFLLKLDTNSTNPEMVYQIHREVGIDALGLDFKAPAARYAELTGSKDTDIADKVLNIIAFALKEGIEADIRTTVHKRLLSPADLQAMADALASLGAPTWTLQQFNPVEVIDDYLPEVETYSDAELVALARKLGSNVRVRGLNGRIIN